jgi:GTP:adenosylcobinamide-phosphate guanylyltransferase
VLDPYYGAVPIKALVLAGRREGGDAAFDSPELSHKALLPIAGVPMLERVVRTLEESGVCSSISVSTDDPRLVFSTPYLAELADEKVGFLHTHRSGTSPAASVADFCTIVSHGEPVFCTTADHPLLTPEIVRYFYEHASGRPADFVVGLVPATVYRRRFPEHERTFIRLRGEKYSGANLFLLRTPRAAEVPRFWTRAEQYRKTPWKLVSVFGFSTLVSFLLGRMDLSQALDRASDVIGAGIDAVELPFAEAALDVDKFEDRLAVEEIFAERGDGKSGTGEHNADASIVPDFRVHDPARGSQDAKALRDLWQPTIEKRR